ncbi:Amino acid permease [Geodermatophilus amargosae]|uniref:Amino acid permease n=1 Tax=Geodermatophilus amargosae TaxID=1296565 RepID=A0A1I7BU15_9ACTN|nr:Amino acid permease [Geodermatophilus amargosae]
MTQPLWGSDQRVDDPSPAAITCRPVDGRRARTAAAGPPVTPGHAPPHPACRRSTRVTGTAWSGCRASQAYPDSIGDRPARRGHGRNEHRRTRHEAAPRRHRPLLYLFILGDVLGAGVYALVGEVAGEVGGAIWVPLLVALLLALLTAASYAELVTTYPRAGGSAVFAERVFRSPVVAFLVGFCMLAAGVTSAAGLALAFAGDYLGVFLDVPAAPAALVFLLAVALLNARGIQESLRANLVMTLVESSGLVLVVVLGAVVLSRGDGDLGRSVEFPPGVSAGTAVLSAALLAYYSFVGFETSANVAEEVRDVRRVYPRALFGALLTAGLVYVLVGIAAAVVLPPGDLAGSSGPLLEVVRAADAGIPDRLFSLVALIAVANGALLTMIMASRHGVRAGRAAPAAGGPGSGAAAPPDAVGGHRRHHAGGHGPEPGRRPGHAGQHGGAPAAVRLHQHQHRGAGAAP